MSTAALRNYIIGIMFSALVLFGLAPIAVGAQDFDPLGSACDAGSAQNTALCNESQNRDDTLVGSEGVLSRAVNLLTIATAIIAVIIVVISGIRMITSRGDPNTINTARNTIIYAAIGIAVVVMARTIILLVADRL